MHLELSDIQWTHSFYLDYLDYLLYFEQKARTLGHLSSLLSVLYLNLSLSVEQILWSLLL